MQIIENSKFKAEINEQGAELIHLYHKTADFDYIWNDDLWPKHAPVLFPAIGRSEADSYILNGEKYTMPQHGFVADQVFEVVENNGTEVEFSLSQNETTMDYYPFKFTLTVRFILTDTGLSLVFNVQNNDLKTLAYSLGSHPAFNVPINGQGQFSDYMIEFKPQQSQLNQFEIVKRPAPYRTGQIIPVKNFSNAKLLLDYEMFEAGLVIIENDGISSLKLTSEHSQHSVEVTLDDFRYVCLWTKEAAEAPFLCIEPFNGLPDVAGEMSELLTKEGNSLLEAGQNKTYTYQIKLN